MSSSITVASLKPPSSSSTSTLNYQKNQLKDSIYVASVPLTAAKGPPRLLMSAAYSFNFWDIQHFMVIIKSPQQPDAVVFDFQPQDPENLFAALAVLSGRKVTGVVLKRTLSKLPKNKCWFVGFADLNSVEIAEKFNDEWSSALIVGKHDCRHYTDGLVQRLTGVISVLDLIRVRSRKYEFF